MRVIHLYRNLQPGSGGIYSALLDLAQLQRSQGMQVIVAGKGVDGRARDDFASLADLIDLRDRSGTRRVTDSKADVLHLHGMWDLRLTRLALRISRARVGLVVTPHGMLDEWSLSQRGLQKQTFMAAYGDRLLRRADLVHATASGEAAQLHDVADNKVVVVPWTVASQGYRPPTEAFREQHSMAKGSRHVAYFGRIHPKKGPELLPSVLRQVLATGVDMRLHYIGDGDRAHVAAVRQAVADTGMSQHVKMHGFVAGPDRFALLSACDAMVLPTQQENFGMVFFEALAHGCPVVTTEAIDTAALLRSSDCAWLVPATARALSQALIEATTPETVARIRQDGPAWIEQNFNTHSLGQTWSRIYAEAVRLAA